MDTVRIGIIGAGFIAGTHVAAIQTLADARAVAVASHDLTKAQAFADQHTIPHAFGNYHELLARSDVDAVVVAVPNYLHSQVVEAAAAAGKHVLCEKPLCLTIDEGQKMRDACRRHGVQLVYAEVLPYVPKYVRAQELRVPARWAAFSLCGTARSIRGRTPIGSGIPGARAAVWCWT